MISFTIRKTEKGKEFVLTFWKLCSAHGVNIRSVNLDRETTFLTLPSEQPSLCSKTEFCQPPPNFEVWSLVCKKASSVNYDKMMQSIVQFYTRLQWQSGLWIPMQMLASQFEQKQLTCALSPVDQGLAHLPDLEVGRRDDVIPIFAGEGVDPVK